VTSGRAPYDYRQYMYNLLYEVVPWTLRYEIMGRIVHSNILDITMYFGQYKSVYTSTRSLQSFAQRLNALRII
jgi:hypothetical protein